MLDHLNRIANACSAILFVPIAWVPGWVSATTIGVVTGVLMLLAYKYTSHQTAIKRTRDQIKANLLALSLFKDSVPVGLRAQARLLGNAGRLLVLSLVPMLVMTVPMVLLLGQMALWYQARPLRIGESAVVTVQLGDSVDRTDRVALVEADDFSVKTGPVHVPAQHMVCWDIVAQSAGMHQLEVSVGDQVFAKQWTAGDRYMPTSLKRPACRWTEMLVHPRERPFPPDGPVQSIEIVFPERHSWTAGSGTWLVYWFVVSMVAAFVARPLLKVNI